MENGKVWLDTEGKPIHAHGGCRLKFNGKIYWYGEDRRGNNYISCYVSDDDGQSWRFANHILTKTSTIMPNRVRSELSLTRSDGGKINLERPKVLYNEITKKFVLWAHYENGIDYTAAAVAVASCSTPDGNFVYHGSFRPYGEMSRGCTLFKDDDGKVYFITSSRDNADLVFYLLSEDYLNVSKVVNKVFSNEYREAPAIIKSNEKYLLVTSECTGWYPNQGGYSVADSIDGVWSDIRKFGNETTFLSQSAFLYKNSKGEIVYFGDRWGGEDFAKRLIKYNDFDYFKSGYVAYKIEFYNGKATLIHSDDAVL